LDIGNAETYDTNEPLRLRGGGDEEPGSKDVEMATASNTTPGNSGDMVKTGIKRGPASPSGLPAKKNPDNEYGTRLNAIFGWLEHTISVERAKKLTVQASEGMMDKISELRNIMHILAGENSHLKGRLMEREDNAKETLTTFVTKINQKAAEIGQLKSEILELKKVKDIQAVPPTAVTSSKVTTYAQTVSGKPQVAKASAPKEKPKDLDRCRKARASTRFVVDVPADKTVANVKTELWQTVKSKLPNPRAKTILSGKSLIIIPDDNNTLEVLRNVPNLKSVGPKQPRIIIYDVDSELSEVELADGLLLQNPELGLTRDEIQSMDVKHKLGPRNGSTTHWVIETPAHILPKLENKSVYLGMTRCRIKVHKNTTQCYHCQKFGHTALKCNQELPTCRHCAKSHDSRECTDKNKAVCTNCRGDHKASSASCKSRGRAVQSLLRRTDFGE